MEYCALFVGWLFSLIVISAIFGEEAASVSGTVVMFPFLFWAFRIYLKKSKLAENEKANTQAAFLSRLKEKGFSPEYSYRNPDCSELLALDVQRRTLLIDKMNPESGLYEHTALVIDKLINLEILENNTPIIRSGSSDALSGAIAGGLMFGGAGAVVGAMANKRDGSLSRIDLAMQTNDHAQPYFRYNFLGDRNVLMNSHEHQKILEDARLWAGRIEALKYRMGNRS